MIYYKFVFLSAVVALLVEKGGDVNQPNGKGAVLICLLVVVASFLLSLFFFVDSVLLCVLAQYAGRGGEYAEGWCRCQQQDLLRLHPSALCRIGTSIRLVPFALSFFSIPQYLC